MSLNQSPNLRHRNRDLFDTIKEIRRPVVQPNTGWINVVATVGGLPNGDPGVINASNDEGFTPVFQNSWANLNASIYPPASFYQSEDGEIRLRGAITGGTPSTVVYTLPTGYRPEFNTRIVCPTSAAGTYATFEIATNGDVTFIG